MTLRNFPLATGLVAVVAMVTSIGCGAMTVPNPESKKQNSTVAAENSPLVPSVDSRPTEADHAHKPGSNGGIIIPIGTDSYHAEAVIEKSGTIRLLTLGKDESRVQEVDQQSIKAYVKIIGQSDTTPVELMATPQEGDTPGQTSQFVGALPDELRGQPLEVVIPNIRIKGERFRIGFTTQTASHQEEMPAGLPAAEEQALERFHG